MRDLSNFSWIKIKGVILFRDADKFNLELVNLHLCLNLYACKIKNTYPRGKIRAEMCLFTFKEDV